MLFRVCNFVSPAKLLYQTAKTCQFEEKSLFFCVFFDFSYSFLFRAQRYDKKCTYASNLIISSNFIRKSPLLSFNPLHSPSACIFSTSNPTLACSFFSIKHNTKPKKKEQANFFNLYLFLLSFLSPLLLSLLTHLQLAPFFNQTEQKMI